MRISDWSSDVCSSDLHRHDALRPLAGGDVGTERQLRHGGAGFCREAEPQGRAGMPVPDLDRIDAVPVRALARLQQEIDRRRARPAGGVGLRITEGLGEIPTFGMRLQAERGDDLVCGHAYRSEEHTSELQSLMRISNA